MTDPDALTAMSERSLRRVVDRLVAKIDKDAVRRRKEAVEDREIWIADSQPGMAAVCGSMFATDAHVLDQRLDALAATVCEADPRSHEQRRADALGALVAGADRLTCGCGKPDCCAAGPASKSNVVVHVVAEEATVEGRADTPAYLVGGHELIPAELVAELAKEARIRPLFDAVTAAKEPSRTPSAKLADFVRARDLWGHLPLAGECRAPGCDKPATHCDIDHTIAFADGGPTHASKVVRCC